MYYSRPVRPQPLVSPKSYDEDFDYLEFPQPKIYDLVVYDEDDIDTGIVDAEGNAIVRSERIPIGFLADLFEG